MRARASAECVLIKKKYDTHALVKDTIKRTDLCARLQNRGVCEVPLRVRACVRVSRSPFGQNPDAHAGRSDI